MTNKEIEENNKARFRWCEEIKCPLRYKCQEKLIPRDALGGNGIDWFCKKINDTVYKE